MPDFVAALGIRKSNPASKIASTEQDRGEEQIGCSLAARGCGSHEVHSRDVIGRTDVPPHGVNSLESLAAASPDAESKGESRNEQRSGNPGEEPRMIAGCEQPKPEASASDDRHQYSRNPGGG